MSSDTAELLAEAQAFDSLDRAFRWAVARTPRIVPADVVIQDEYSHDRPRVAANTVSKR